MLLADCVILAFHAGSIGAIVAIAILRIDTLLFLFPLLARLCFFFLLILAPHPTDHQTCASPSFSAGRTANDSANRRAADQSPSDTAFFRLFLRRWSA